jgi:hypothetical protein
MNVRQKKGNLFVIRTQEQALGLLGDVSFGGLERI